MKRLATCSAEVMMDRHRRRLANIKPALVQPPVIIKTILNNNKRLANVVIIQNFAFKIVSIGL